MTQSIPICQKHGTALKRDRCSECNAAYMRWYQKRRRALNPKAALLERAKARAKQTRLAFSLSAVDVDVPATCPALGIPLVIGQARGAGSPSLDRIQPDLGYVPGNVRVISNQANCLKGNRDLQCLRWLANHGARNMRPAYGLLAEYVDRELLLQEVRRQAQANDSHSAEWANVACFLEKRFRNFVVVHPFRMPDNDTKCNDTPCNRILGSA